ncbi:site-specific DNA-methyltransferase [Spirosoma luteum]|uniref:site-specific DNA-methyltransferase n=1 Tax=Spirosoma luteum TaxID=431553 RepID=UPI0003660A2F|nr:site-specific DNA-methyltransferase [Spirosoma luteum]
MDGLSLNIAQDKLSQLRQLFPEVFREDKIDFDALKTILGEQVSPPAQEHYGLTWAGKYDAHREIQKQTTATLTPDRANSINFDTSENVFIEGENLEVLRVLQKSYYGKVKMIYIDPPYNTGNDSFVYPDDYSERQDIYKKRTGITDEEGFLNKQDLWRKNTKESGQFHSVWLSMMFPRLYLSRNLLRNDGVIFVSIDDNEQVNLKIMLDEIFGVENFVGQIIWKNVTDNNPTLINIEHEYILVYAKQKNLLPESWKSNVSDAKTVLEDFYTKCKSQDLPVKEIEKRIRELISDNESVFYSISRYKLVDKDGVYTGSESVHNPKPGGYDFDIFHPYTKRPMRKPANGYRFPKTTYEDMDAAGIILYGEDENRIIKIKKYLSDFEDTLRSVIVLDGRLGSYDIKRLFTGSQKLFNNPKPVELVKSLIAYATDDKDIILDFFAGSGSTAQAVEQLNEDNKSNRRFINVQLPELLDSDTEAYKAGYRTIADISRARIRKVIEKQTQKKNGQLQFQESEPLGFRAYKLTQTHFKVWRSDLSNPADILEQLGVFQHPLTDDYQTEALFTELLLKAGYSLTVPVEREELAGVPVYRVNNGTTYMALEGISRELIEALTARQPQRLITLDKLFNQDNELLSNTRLQLREAGIEFAVI